MTQSARRGVKLADMTPEQREVIAAHSINQSGVEWWRAQGAAQRGNDAEATARMRVSDAMRDQAQRALLVNARAGRR